MKVPSITTRRKAVDIGIRYSMGDEEVLAKLKEAKIIKSQRDIFIPWFRSAEQRSIAREEQK